MRAKSGSLQSADPTTTPPARITPSGVIGGIAAGCRDAALGLADLIWPPECCVCGEPGERFFCAGCRDRITPVEAPYCSRCGRPGARRGCPDCGEEPWKATKGCDTIREVAVYEGVWRDVIHRYKFDGMRCLSDELGAYLTNWLDAAACVWREVDVVTPVPGHFTRRWELGFHHSLDLAVRVSRHLGKPLVHPLVRRAGKSQVGLGREERLANATRLYGLRSGHEMLTGRKVLVVDDVVTTGATADAVGALLKSAGASKVRMVALARNL